MQEQQEPLVPHCERCNALCETCMRNRSGILFKMIKFLFVTGFTLALFTACSFVGGIFLLPYLQEQMGYDYVARVKLGDAQILCEEASFDYTEFPDENTCIFNMESGGRMNSPTEGNFYLRSTEKIPLYFMVTEYDPATRNETNLVLLRTVEENSYQAYFGGDRYRSVKFRLLTKEKYEQQEKIQAALLKLQSE